MPETLEKCSFLTRVPLDRAIAAVPSFCLPEPLRVDENEDPTGVEDYIAQ